MISVALNVFASIIGWIILNVFLNDLDTSASSSIEEIEGVIARAEGGGVFSNLIGAIAAVIIVYAYLNLRDYLNNLYYKYRSHSIKEAADKINITKNGSILIAIATFIQIIPNESISWLLSLPGGIMVVYGLIAGGGQLGRVPFNLTEIGSQKSRDPHSTSRKTSLISKMAYTQKESLQIGSEEKRLEDIYCVICGTRNGQDFNYCKSCGAKLHDLQVS